MTLATFAIGCTDPGAMVAGPANGAAFSLGASGPSISGNATLLARWLTVSFAVRTGPDGTVTGTFESITRGFPCGEFSNDPACQVRVHGAVDCLVVSGSEAIFGGTFSTVAVGAAVPSHPGLAVGERFWGKVRDNGEGAGNSPDEFSDWFIDIGGIPGLTPTTTITECAEYPVVELPGFVPGLAPIDVGGIQVRP